MRWLPKAVNAGGEVPPPTDPAGQMIALSPGYYFPAGNDPYGPNFGDADCVIDLDTGECVRDHPGPHESADPRKIAKEV